tara:strand:- start:1462 stop:2340 length:879 start_codon:yes stop_codon:yes gene_type:complete
LKIISASDFSIGLCISGIGHIGLITWALIGNPFLSRDPFNDLMVTQVNIITEKQFQQERVSKASLSDDEYKGKLSIKKQNNENPLAINNGVKIKERTKTVEKKSGRSKISDLYTLDDKNSSDTEVKGRLTKITKPQLAETTSLATQTVQSEILVPDRPRYKPFDISELLLQEVFRADLNENVIEDFKVIAELQKIIEPAVEKCFNISVFELSVKEASVLVNFSLKENGKPEASSIELMSSNGGSLEDVEKLFGAARRAIIRCGIPGYDLPIDKYDSWKNVEAKFNSKGMHLK